MKRLNPPFLLFLAILLLLQCGRSRRIEWNVEDGYRWADLSISRATGNGLTLLSGPEIGIENINDLTREQIKENRHLLNGSGVTVGDIDADGLPDVYFCRLNSRNVLYKNLGNWKFKDITEKAGVACENQFSTGATFADINGDGHLDLLVTALGGPNACFLNDGSGNFTDFSQESGLTSNTGATTLALADIDGDGDLDLYITNYKVRSIRDIYPANERTVEKTTKKVGDGYIVLPEFQEHYTVEVKNDVLLRFEYAEPDMIFLNDGDGRFSKLSMTDGRFLDEDGNPASEDHDWGLAVRFQDMDNDLDPDIYVCNDFESPDRVWINDGTGRFRAIDKLAIRNTSASSMSIDFADINRDGNMDFFLAEMLSREHKRRKTQMGVMPITPVSIGEIDNRPQFMRNTLFLNRGDRTYAEIAQFGGVQASEWSWSPLFLDVDLDGYEDLLIITGHYYDAMDSDTRNQLKTMANPIYEQLQSEVFAFPTLETSNFIFKNKGDLTFEEIGEEWGFRSVDVSHGMALGDFDNDGDLDAVMNRLNDTPAVYRNEAIAPRIAIRLRGLPPNTQGIGAKIKVLGGPVPQSKEAICGGSYLSGSDQRYVFAAGEIDIDLTIEVTWRDGKYSRLEGARPNRIYEIHESSSNGSYFSESQPSASTAPYFEDVSQLIAHAHHEDPFDDFKRQSLLPNRLSQFGPGVSWVDFDDDGLDDLMITSGRGGKLAAFRNDGKGGFEPMKDRGLTSKTLADQTSVLFWNGDNSNHLLVAHSNFEDENSDDSFLLRYDLKNGKIASSQKIMGNSASVGPTALADYDGDGDLDLFMGGRTIPGRYPEPASSIFFTNENGEFVDDQRNQGVLHDVGLVSGAVFSDIDGDADPDIVLAIEWGPVKVLRNTDGIFTDATDDMGLSEYKGWWNGVTTGDLNADGKMDIIATNWGLNTKYNFYYDHELRIFYDDFDHNGTLDIIEAHIDPVENRLYPERGLSCMSNAMPFVKSLNPTFDEFGSANLDEVIGPRLWEAKQVTASHLEHTVFLNRGDHFEAIVMPAQAQFAPAFYAGIGDFDGDGHEDVFISQNFFSSQIETPRNDAGRGLWLKGDGTGNLEPIPGQESGIKVYGEQRGAALGDYDQDGRVDLVVSQNGAETKLYHNVGAKPGLRVRLAGTKGNPSGIGAMVRLIYADRLGPARDIHAGSGYWSQDSSIQVMGLQEEATGIWVRWPGGEITKSDIPKSAAEITVFQDGTVAVSSGSK
jgi:hypothetical protein